MSAVQVIAHRGDPVHAIENTLPAIERAIADGAEIVEIDIRLSRDGEVVLVHDETTERLFGQAAAVARQTWDELSELASPDGSRIITLDQALRATAGRAQLMIDMTDAAFARAAVPIVRRLGADASWCGDHGALQVVRAALPDAEIYLSMDSGELPTREQVARLRPSHVNPCFEAVTPEYAAAVAELGVGLSCWTVDDVAQARRLVGLGVRAIISNRAQEVRSALQEGI